MKRKISKTAKLDYESPEPFRVQISGDIRKKHLDPNSMFSHFEGGQQELQKLISDNWDKGWLSDQKRGRSSNSEVWIVPLPSDSFYTGLVKINDDSELTAEWSRQHQAQGFRKRVMAKAPQKSKADFARAVVLVSDASFDTQFFVLTINAGLLNEGQDPQTFKEPMNPQTLMYNRYEYGETHSPEEFDKLLRKAFHYWKDKAFYGGPTQRPNPTNELIQMANRLDQKGLKKEADFLDKIIKEAIGELITLDDRRPQKEPSLGVWVDNWGPVIYGDIWFFNSDDNRDEGLLDYDDISEYQSLKKINLQNHPELIHLILSYLNAQKSE